MGKKREASFEDLLAETEAIISELEAGALPLEDALRKYERGVANIQTCAKFLQAAEEKVKVIVEAADGALRLEEFAEDEEDEGEDYEDDESAEKDGA